MYFIKKEQDLHGKTVAFTHFATFAEYLTIVTTDGGIMVIDVTDDGDGKHTQTLMEHQAKQYIFKSEKSKWMVNEFIKIGIIGADEFEEFEAEKRRLEEERIKKASQELEAKERKEYERLKIKFG